MTSDARAKRGADGWTKRDSGTHQGSPMAVAAVAACTWEGNGARVGHPRKVGGEVGGGHPLRDRARAGTCRTPFLSELLRVIP